MTRVPIAAGMLNADDIRTEAQGLWDSGRLLRAWLGAEDLFPWSLPLSPPRGERLSAELPGLAECTLGIEAGCKCAGGEGYRIEYLELADAPPGPGRIPQRVVFDTPQELIGYLGKSPELGEFVRLARDIRRRRPGLKAWIEAKPLEVLDHRKDWPRLLEVLEWLREHPESGVLRQESAIPGAEDGFIAEHADLLRELFDSLQASDRR